VRRFLPHSLGTLEQIVSEVASAAQAAANSNAQEAITHSENAAREAASWYSVRAGRHFFLRAAIGLIAGFGGLVGSALMFRQTILLGEQNKKLQEQTLLLRDQNQKIDLQTVTAEAQRRSVLVPELLAIQQELVIARSKHGGMQPLELQNDLLTRIAAFSRA